MLRIIKRRIDKNPLSLLVHIIVTIEICVAAYVLLSAVLFFNTGDTTKPNFIPSDSMEPTIMANSIVWLEEVEYEDIQLGDIIKYKNNIMTYDIVHRVVAIGDDFIIAKGDNNDSVDYWMVRPSMIKGRVIKIDNSISPVLTAMLGKCDMNDMAPYFTKLAVAVIIAAVILGLVIIYGSYWLLDLITSNIFWIHKKNKMQQSIEWMDNNNSKDEFNNIIDDYRGKLKQAKWYQKPILWEKFRKYYSEICSQEKYATKADKNKTKLYKFMSKIKT